MNQFQLSARSDSFLFLGEWEDETAGKERCENLRHISPPRFLKTVELRIGRARQRGIPEQVVSWFFVPSLLKAEQSQAMSFTVENAVIALGDRAACLLDGETPETQQTLSTMWASLRTLDCNFSSLNRVHQAILLCTGLRQLTIGAEVFWKLAEVHLPKHLEHLVLICYDVDFISVHDKAASDLLNQASATSGSQRCDEEPAEVGVPR